MTKAEGEVLLFLTACAGQSAQMYSVLSYLGNQVEGEGDSHIRLVLGLPYTININIPWLIRDSTLAGSAGRVDASLKWKHFGQYKRTFETNLLRPATIQLLISERQ